MSATADIYVVVSNDNPISRINKKQLVAIYTGRSKAFPGGGFAKPIDQADGSDLKVQFYRVLTNRSISQINAYWARLVFSGRVVPPLEIKSEVEILRVVSQSKEAIAYVSAPRDDLVKTIYIIKTEN